MKNPDETIKPTPQIPSVEVKGRLFSPTEMALVAVLGTAALTGAVNYFNGEGGRPKMPAIEVEWGGVRGASAQQTDKETGSERVVHQTTRLRDTMTEEWAQHFASDPEAGDLINPKEIDTFADGIKDATEKGWSIKSIKVRGTTSAEDDSTDINGVRTAGLQQTTPTAAEKQEQLGDVRRDTGTLELAQALHDRGVDIDASQIELLPSIEDVLSDEEVAVIDGLTTQFGYSSKTVMIEQWNRDPDSSPPEVDRVLTEMLFKERQFQVEIGLDRLISIPDKETPHTSEDDDHKFRFLPFLLPGYLFVTASGRRRPQFVSPARAESPVPITEKPPSNPKTYVEPYPRQRRRVSPKPREVIRTAPRRYKQPRPQNMHGSRGSNTHVGRSRGGNRRGKRG